MGSVRSTTGAATIMTRMIVAITALPSAMSTTIGVDETRPSVTTVISASDRYIAAKISRLETSLTNATVNRYPATLRSEKIAPGCTMTRRTT